jgi:hypothetical protein
MSFGQRLSELDARRHLGDGIDIFQNVPGG